MTWTIGLLGFLVGFLCGVVFQDAWKLLPQRRRKKMAEKSPLQWFSGNLLTVVLIVSVLFNLLVGILLIQQRAASEDYSTCNAEFQGEFQASYEARSNAAAQTSAAIDKIVLAVGSFSPEDMGRLRGAVDNYLTVREQQKIQRENNPIPEPPDELCGDPIR